jgi:hypothetical protein
MSATTITSAINRFNAWKTALSGMTITNVVITPGYGIGWTQDGVNKSARIPEIEAKDSDYIAKWNELLTGASSSDTGTLAGAAKSNPMYLIGGAVVAFFVGRWIYKKMFKRPVRRRRR